MVVNRADAFFLPKAQREVYLRKAIPLLDLTNIDPSAKDEDIAGLCGRAIIHGTAGVCVGLGHASRARALVQGKTRLAVAAGGFPRGAGPLEGRLDEISRARDLGADEIDAVTNLGALMAGDMALLGAELRQSRKAAGPLVLKIILESGELDSGTLREASRIAIAEGADFLKTSTGFSGRGASLEAVGIMLDEMLLSGRIVGIKPSGGIKTADQALGYMILAESKAGSGMLVPERFRLGASALLDSILSEIQGAGTGG